ncbi:MAG TPA: phosphoribosyltransferase family protein [Chthoniobacterales bacterium]
MQFRDRADAGQYLARRLEPWRGQPGLLVLALPRGGVPVGYEVARALSAPLDVLVVRKLGVPGREELAMGAVASGGVRVLNEDVIAALGPRASEAIEQAVRRETEELRRREARYRGARAVPNLAGRTVILVDDGLATGATMRAAARAVRQRRPARLIIAVPVASQTTCREMQSEADEVVCGLIHETFFGIGQFYENFRQTTDEEVQSYLGETGRKTTEPNE